MFCLRRCICSTAWHTWMFGFLFEISQGLCGLIWNLFGALGSDRLADLFGCNDLAWFLAYSSIVPPCSVSQIYLFRSCSVLTSVRDLHVLFPKYMCSECWHFHIVVLFDVRFPFLCCVRGSDLFRNLRNDRNVMKRSIFLACSEGTVSNIVRFLVVLSPISWSVRNWNPLHRLADVSVRSSIRGFARLNCFDLEFVRCIGF